MDFPHDGVTGVYSSVVSIEASSGKPPVVTTQKVRFKDGRCVKKVGRPRVVRVPQP